MVSAYEQSTALREAALLLSPDNWEDRLRLYNDYRSWAELRRLKFHELRRDPKSSEDVKQIDVNRKRFGEIQTHHLEVVLHQSVGRNFGFGRP